MNKLFRLYIIIGVFAVLGLSSCIDDENYSLSKTDLLAFSTDTVKLDTTFSNVPTPTKTMWVYNRTGKDLRCSSVRLEGGNQNGFRVNVDGTYLGQTSGYQTKDVEIRKGDSIRVFVELTSPMQGSDQPELVEDNLVFDLESGVQQKLNLHAVSWDADLRKNGIQVTDTLTLDSKKPIVIYGGVKVGKDATLTIKAGTTLYFHENAGMEIAGKLNIVGNADEEVALRGDRIDHMFDYLPYDRTPGQWQGIHFLESSYGNEIRYADIHSAYDGIKIDSCDVTQQKLLMENSTVHNCQGVGVSVEYAKVQLNNCQLSNTLGHCLYVEGGDVDVNQCTIAQFYPFDGNRGSAIGFKAPVPHFDVKNSLVTGYAEDEVVWTPVDDKPLEFAFDHCVLRTEKMMTDDSLKFTNVIYEDVKDTTQFGEKHFVKVDTDKLVYDFHLRTASAAIGVADPKTALPEDRNGIKRDEEKPDAGCYQHRDKEEKK